MSEALICHDVNGNAIEVVPQRGITIKVDENQFVSIGFKPKLMTDKGVIFPIIHYKKTYRWSEPKIVNTEYILGVDLEELDLINSLHEGFKDENRRKFQPHLVERRPFDIGSRTFGLMENEDDHSDRSFRFQEDSDDLTTFKNSGRFGITEQKEDTDISHTFSFFET